MLRYLSVSFPFLFGAIATLIGFPMLVGSVLIARDPSMIQDPGDGPLWLLPLIFGVIGVVLGPLGLYLVRRGWLGAQQTLRLLQNGLLTEGTVISVDVNRNVQINGRNPLFLQYEYHGPDGRSYRGRSPHLPRKLEDHWQAGSRVPVVCDPVNPGRSEADIFRMRTPQLN